MNRPQSQTNWLEPYQTALLELEREKLRDRVDLAQTAIQKRVRELLDSGNGSAEERQKIEDALANLRILLKQDAPRIKT